jgi:hypothetical protein
VTILLIITRVTLIDESQFDRLASDVLHSLRQLTNLGSVLFIGWRDQQGQQIPQLFAIVPISLSSSFLCPFP